jgi:hypothetical protein
VGWIILRFRSFPRTTARSGNPRRSKPGRQIGCNARPTLAKLNKIEFEEGWHFIRILPWTADGDPIPLEADSGSESAKRSYESEPFYVLPGGNIEEEPPQRAIPIEQSLEHARFRLQLTALGDERDPDEIAIAVLHGLKVDAPKRFLARKPC